MRFQKQKQNGFREMGLINEKYNPHKIRKNPQNKSKLLAEFLKVKSESSWSPAKSNFFLIGNNHSTTKLAEF